MTARILSCVVIEKPDEFIENWKFEWLQQYRSARGMISLLIMRRSFKTHSEFLAISIWESPDEMESFAVNCADQELHHVGQQVIPMDPREYEVVASCSGSGFPDCFHRQ